MQSTVRRLVSSALLSLPTSACIAEDDLSDSVDASKEDDSLDGRDCLLITGRVNDADGRIAIGNKTGQGAMVFEILDEAPQAAVADLRNRAEVRATPTWRNGLSAQCGTP